MSITSGRYFFTLTVELQISFPATKSKKDLQLSCLSLPFPSLTTNRKFSHSTDEHNKADPYTFSWCTGDTDSPLCKWWRGLPCRAVRRAGHGLLIVICGFILALFYMWFCTLRVIYLFPASFLKLICLLSSTCLHFQTVEPTQADMPTNHPSVTENKYLRKYSLDLGQVRQPEVESELNAVKCLPNGDDAAPSFTARSRKQ